MYVRSYVGKYVRTCVGVQECTRVRRPCDGCLSVHRPFVCMSVLETVRLSICPFVLTNTHGCIISPVPGFRPSIRPSVRPSVRPYVCTYVLACLLAYLLERFCLKRNNFFIKIICISLDQAKRATVWIGPKKDSMCLALHRLDLPSYCM